jgi:hypothetical protein
MTPLKAHPRIVLVNKNLLLLKSNTTRRIMFFVLFLLLTTAMIFGFEPERDLAGNRLLLTIGYIVALIVLLGVAGWSKTIRLDKDRKIIESESLIFGISAKREEMGTLDLIDAVVLQQVQLLKGGDMTGRTAAPLKNIFEPKSQLVRLFLETEEERIKLDEGDSVESLETEATAIADFLGVPVRSEEL